MKKLFYLILVSAVLIGVASCKTTEANYKTAYEIAKKKKTETGDSLIDRSLANSNNPKLMVIQGVQLPVFTEYVGLTKGEFTEGYKIKRYCVVVGKFTQLFNARQMRKRMINCGYDDACLLQNRTNQFYVSVATTADPVQADSLLQSVKNDTAIVLREPYPYILRPGQLVR